jgi:phosphate/sulfate permease
MKKIVLVICFMTALGFHIVGQTEMPISKAHYFAGGVIGFGTKTLDAINGEITISQRTNSLELSPNFGYFIINKMALGLKANSIFTKTKFLTNGESIKESKFLLSPFIRYYVYSGFFGETDFGFGKIKYEEDKGSILRGILCLGYSIFLNDKISLEPILSLEKYKENWNSNFVSDNNFTAINFSLSLQAFF